MKSGAVLWEFKAIDVSKSLAIGFDGTIYFGSYTEKKVYALDGKTGSKKWEFNTSNKGISSPAIGPDGTVYFGSRDKKIYALNGKTGSKKWEYETGSEVCSSPVIGSDGTVYVGLHDKNIYALNGQTGALKWVYETTGGIHSSLTIGPDGTVYAGLDKVYALDGATGIQKWEYTVSLNVVPPAIGPNGTVYVLSRDLKKIYALNGKDGTKKWEFKSGEPSMLGIPGIGELGSPVIGDDGMIYVGSIAGGKKIYSLDDKTGIKLWEFEMKEAASPHLAIGSDSTVYAGANDHVYALDGASGIEKWSHKTKGNIIGTPVIGSFGLLYFNTKENKIYAIKIDSKGPAKILWPKRSQNPQHTGRAPKK